MRYSERWRLRFGSFRVELRHFCVVYAVETAAEVAALAGMAGTAVETAARAAAVVEAGGIGGGGGVRAFLAARSRASRDESVCVGRSLFTVLTSWVHLASPTERGTDTSAGPAQD